MRAITRISILPALALLLGACAGTALDEAEYMTPQGPEFERHLHANYVDMSRGEFNEQDFPDSDKFAERAIAAASGAAPAPEDPSRRDIPRKHRRELAEARDALMTAFANGVRETNPVMAARAQIMFDCWVQEQEESFQPEEIRACRDGFHRAMAEVNAPPVAEQLEDRGEARVYGIHFDFDSAAIRPVSEPVLQEIRAVLEASPLMKLRIEGHTDAVGTDAYNADLSERRAHSVVNWLVENGIAEERLEARGAGESEPVAGNDTAAGRAENRRVELEAWTN